VGMQTVVILNVGSASFKARPAYAVTKPGEQVKFSNYTGQIVTLTFPTGLFDKNQLILSNGVKDTLTVQDVADDRYTYTGDVNGVEVVGESSPEIIVDR